MCRDLTSYLMSLPCKEVKGHQGDSLSLMGRTTNNHGHQQQHYGSTATTDRKLNNNGSDQDALMLMSAMTFMKLQICYFGNMALRSSALFAIVGSLLAAVIPVIVEKEA